MIRVLVADDSAVVRELLAHVLRSDPEIEVIGMASDGEDAVGLAVKERPDVITMDIHMPKMDGFEATRRIMETAPVPIVIVSGTSTPREAAFSLRAAEAGALAFVQRPPGLGNPRHEGLALELIQTVKLMSEVKVVRRWKQRPPPADVSPRPHHEPVPAIAEVRLVAIGASTGGPPVLQRILHELPAEFPAPILVVQHIVSGFTEGLAAWLAETCRLPVELARDGAVPRPAHVYLAPDDAHLGVGGDGTMLLSEEPPLYGHRPAVAHLLRSVADVHGRHAVGILLTGMGSDGARELKLMRDRGAVTIAQDEESSVVYGMPGAAQAIGAAALVLPPPRIAALLAGIRTPAPPTKGGPS